MPAAPLGLSDGERDRLETWMRAPTTPSGLVRRARIVLLSAEGVPDVEIAVGVGVSLATVSMWRARYRSGGLTALHDRVRPGRPRTIDHRAILAATLTAPPTKLGVAQWSSRALGRHLHVSGMTVIRAWREYGIQPWQVGTFKFNTDPELVATVTDIVGLYLARPTNAVVLCADEEPRDLERAAPVLAGPPGPPERRAHDGDRGDATATVSAALELAAGRGGDQCPAWHDHQELLRLLRVITRAHPDRALHLITDTHLTHQHPAVKTWLARNNRVQVHCAPSTAAWVNFVECWFSIIERRLVHRHGDVSAAELNARIRAFIEGRNPGAHPFTWTKTASPIPVPPLRGEQGDRDGARQGRGGRRQG